MLAVDLSQSRSITPENHPPLTVELRPDDSFQGEDVFGAASPIVRCPASGMIKQIIGDLAGQLAFARHAAPARGRRR
ncbi:hypothetical protein [Phenylobacterium sp.]|uniref:hypothetical protein n=1 Tax=Phenylobacterium sp. TaxID=1871053 RepID=UPI00121C493C|nr:hypothetical protein [Phenylobacterium sp.]THD62080.1 MAG: hypothetical protein E8A12_09665 [Phenylobacterium sp.]